MLNDMQTGLPLAVMDGGYITNVRTAAASAVAAKYLANPDARVLGIVGAGIQGRYDFLDDVKGDLGPSKYSIELEGLSALATISLDL